MVLLDINLLNYFKATVAVPFSGVTNFIAVYVPLDPSKVNS